MSMIKKNMEITLKKDPNLADLLLQGCRQIIEQLADEFNLDKSTIELGKTFDRETELIGSNKKVYTINTIKYNNYYLAVAFGLEEANVASANTLLNTINGMSRIQSDSTDFKDIISSANKNFEEAYNLAVNRLGTLTEIIANYGGR